MALVSNEILRLFREHFGNTAAQPEICRAPGRVNLIGEHTDYNLGFVLPVALEMACYAGVGGAEHGELRIFSRDLQKSFSLPLADLPSAQPRRDWTDYVVGVALELHRSGIRIPACNILFASEVPAGSGLSSSAALEVATATALLQHRDFGRIEIAKLAQRAESGFVGMPCGIMDQYASVFGRKGSALKIDCRDLSHEFVQLPTNVRIVAVNSLVKHELGTSAYRERVAECKEAVKAIQAVDADVKSLRDVSLELFERIQDSVPLVPRKRARHVISDTQRVVDLKVAAEGGDLNEMGRLFVASHRSMQYDYEITCAEIDFLVDTAIKIPGVYGARMTGGGFGGCTVNLVAPEALENFETTLGAAYLKRYQLTPVFYRCEPAAGAGWLQ